MEVKATDVKKLREKTGAGMMDCKNALVKAENDFDKAEKILKELGLAAARKRASRTTKEGRIFSSVQSEKGVILEISCETDFVAKNEEFIVLGKKLTEIALEKGTGVRKEDFTGPIEEAIGRIKENISLRRFKVYEIPLNEILVDYIHGEGRIGVLIKLTVSDESLKENPRVKEVSFDIALHAAAFAPLFLSRDKVEDSYLKEQEEMYTKQAESLGKPEKILKGIVQGKLNKHLSEICFLNQSFVKDKNIKVSKVLDILGKEVNGEIEISDYVYYKVGEE